MSRIEWRHNGRQLTVAVSILTPADDRNMTSFEGQALVDTGSTVSGITGRVAEKLGLPKRGKRPLGSAQGEGQAERYLFRIGLTGDRVPETPPAFPFLFDDVIGIELNNSFRFDALLGMDVLRQCDFRMERGGRTSLAFD